MTPSGEIRSQPSSLPFSEQEMFDKVARTPLPVLLYNLIEYPHSEYDAGTGYTKLTNRLVERMGLTEEEEHRILMGTGPENDEEEELFLLTNLRGAFAGLTARLIQDPSLPEEVRVALFENALKHPINDWQHAVGRTSIISDYANHLDEDTRSDTFLQVDEGVEESIHSLYEKADQLISFFRAKRSLPDNPDGIEEANLAANTAGHTADDKDRIRLDIADYFIKVFSPDTEPEQINSMYTGTLIAPEERKRRQEAYRNSPQFRIDRVDSINYMKNLLEQERDKWDDRSIASYEADIKRQEEQLRQLDAGEPVQYNWLMIEVD